MGATNNPKSVTTLTDDSSSISRMYGTVKEPVRVDKGFAFIAGDDGVDRFLHNTEYSGDFLKLRPHDRLEFSHQDNPKGARAVRAVPVIQ
jgi:cold shock CspA family protein